MKIVKKNTTYFINPKDDQESQIIDKYLFSEISLQEITKDVLCFVKKEQNNVLVKETNTKTKIINLLNDKSLDFKNKIEGNFEKLLNSKDLEVFKEMIKNKEIVLDKLSNKYKKSFYKPNFQKKSSTSKINDFQKDFSEFTKKEYIIFNNDSLAQKFSQKFSDLLKTGEIRGTKSFDGFYYLVYSSVFDKVSHDVQKIFNKDFTISDVIAKTKYSEDLVKCVLEILKEDCVIIEKKKGVYYKV